MPCIWRKDKTNLIIATTFCVSSRLPTVFSKFVPRLSARRCLLQKCYRPCFHLALTVVLIRCWCSPVHWRRHQFGWTDCLLLQGDILEPYLCCKAISMWDWFFGSATSTCRVIPSPAFCSSPFSCCRYRVHILLLIGDNTAYSVWFLLGQ